MDWNLVKVFLAVCETGSQVRAARLTGLSHATVFRHIALLEEQTGTRLFDRVKGRFVLTDAGNEMREIGLGIARFFEAIDRRVSGRDGNAEGIVRLTAPRSFADTVLPRYLMNFSEAHPNVRVELLVSNQEMNMSDRGADVALRVAHNPPDHLWGRRVLDIDWAIYAAPSYLETAARLDGPSDLSQHKLATPVGQLLRHPVFRDVLNEKQPVTAIACDDLTAMARLAAEGCGVALLPDDLRRSDLKRCFTYHTAPANPLWVLTHPDLRGVHRISLLMGFLAKEFVRDPYWRRTAENLIGE
ncbi:LysR family transcriptional regulator [Neorhizobium tomejilense]|uniref:LysR family transcriptional regulator n=1 Tax=Neorhizobium tomejilense TaxID=2093828 RepID=UPI000CF9134C|nr:LysR family transcriptional regulator [Neorhizobium tomejilense]